MQINFITCNKHKVKEVQQILGNKIKVNQIEIYYPELRSDYPEEIAKVAAKQLADKLKKTIIVEDSGLFIKALKGFPGTSSAYIHQRIELKGILKLMKGIKNREAMYMSAIGYCEPKKKPLSFLGVEKGKIAKKIKGKYGFGHDPIFIPEVFGNEVFKPFRKNLVFSKSSRKTYGEMPNVEEVKKFRRRTVLKLLDYLKNKKNKN